LLPGKISRLRHSASHDDPEGDDKEQKRDWEDDSGDERTSSQLSIFSQVSRAARLQAPCTSSRDVKSLM